MFRTIRANVVVCTNNQGQGDSQLEHLSPLGWEHIHVTGDPFSFLNLRFFPFREVRRYWKCQWSTINCAFICKLLRRHLPGLLSNKKSCDIACGIGKHGQLRASWYFGWREDCLASKVLHPIKCCLQIFDLRVYGNAFTPVIRGTNAAVDASRTSVTVS